MPELLQTLQGLTAVVEQSITHPYGPPATPELRQLAGKAVVFLCDGDNNRARSLWKLIEKDCGSYMPFAVASSLVRAANTTNLVPDVEAPDVN